MIIYTPWTVDEYPAVRGIEGQIVISDARGYVAALIPYEANEAFQEDEARVVANAVADAVNRASEAE